MTGNAENFDAGDFDAGAFAGDGFDGALILCTNTSLPGQLIEFWKT
jgi:hypothetical protein